LQYSPFIGREEGGMRENREKGREGAEGGGICLFGRVQFCNLIFILYGGKSIYLEIWLPV
jgi:hypothetical protein